MSFRYVLQFACILALLCASAFSQDTSAINGQAFDPTSTAVPGDTVEVINRNTRFGRKAASNPEGAFFIQALFPGEYNLVAQVAGFETFTQTGIQVSVGRNTPADMHLDIDAVADNVTVQAIALGVDTHGSTVGSSIMGTGGRLHLFRDGYRYLPSDSNKSVGPLSAVGRDGPSHVRNWLECIRSREEPNSNVVDGHYLAAACHLSNAAYFQNQLAYWREAWDLEMV